MSHIYFRKKYINSKTTARERPNLCIYMYFNAILNCGTLPRIGFLFIPFYLTFKSLHPPKKTKPHFS